MIKTLHLVHPPHPALLTLKHQVSIANMLGFAMKRQGSLFLRSCAQC